MLWGEGKEYSQVPPGEHDGNGGRVLRDRERLQQEGHLIPEGRQGQTRRHPKHSRNQPRVFNLESECRLFFSSSLWMRCGEWAVLYTREEATPVVPGTDSEGPPQSR